MVANQRLKLFITPFVGNRLAAVGTGKYPVPQGTSSPWQKPTVHQEGINAWRLQVLGAVRGAVDNAAFKVLESAKADAPVRDVFKHGSAYRRHGLRRRRLTLQEVGSEDYLRYLFKQDYERVTGRKTKGPLTRFGGQVLIRSRGRRYTADPYLRRAAPRRHPNAFDPFLGGETREGGREVEHGKLVQFPGALTPGRGNMYKRSPLHARGRYELRSGRALFTSKGTTTLGGRLRGEIRKEDATVNGAIITARVVSPTYYARYQEFGTRHNRATPYMRPAVAKMRGTYRSDILKALQRTNLGSGLSRSGR